MPEDKLLLIITNVVGEKGSLLAPTPAPEGNKVLRVQYGRITKVFVATNPCAWRVVDPTGSTVTEPVALLKTGKVRPISGPDVTWSMLVPEPNWLAVKEAAATETVSPDTAVDAPAHAADLRSGAEIGVSVSAGTAMLRYPTGTV
jgi:hypothetical protein